MKLMGTHALLACTQQMVSQQPFAQGDMAVFKDRSNGHGKLLTPSSALPYASADMLALLGLLRPQAIGVIVLAAVRADRSIGLTEALDFSSSLKCWASVIRLSSPCSISRQ